MEVRPFTVKPKQHPLSPPITSCISPAISLRPQLFGLELRPPGLHRPPRRRNCCRLGLGLGFQFQSPPITTKRFVFRTSASLDPQTVVVVVSFVAVSALSVLYFDYANRKHRDESKKISDPLDHRESRQSISITNSNFDDHMSSPVVLQGGESKAGSEDTVKVIKDIIHDFQDELAQAQSGETVLLHEVSLPAGAIASTIIESSTSSEVELSSQKVSGIFESSSQEPPNLLELSSQESSSVSLASGDVSSNFPTAKSGVYIEEHHKTGQGFELPKNMGHTEMIAAFFPANDKEAGDDVLEERNYRFTEEEDISRYNGAAIKSARNELHLYYEGNQYAMNTMENINKTKAMPGLPSSGNKHFSLPLSSSTSQGERFSAKEFLHFAEKFEARLHDVQSERGPFHGRKNYWKNRGSGNDQEKDLTKDDLKILLSLSLLKKQSTSIDYPSQQLRAYNRFLKEGRLNDCLERLEHLEKKGLLDMNNVYHAGFFRMCKTQKAVKEAFRFTNLISNPTLSTFNMLMSVCAISQDSDGAFEVLRLVKKAGLKADCKLYTTLISTCAKSRKVDTMFKVFHEMVNSGVEPNVHTYGALIDGCAKAGQVAKAFGAYGIMRSKNVKPDRVVFNALISACGQSGAVDRAFDVLSEMRSEIHPIDPDHVTVGALMKACLSAGQIERSREIYNMIPEFEIKGTPEVYTIAVNSCSRNGDWEFACNVFNDMKKNGVVPDEMFFSALIDVAGHAGKLDAAFEIVREAKKGGIDVGIISYSSMMGACSNAKNWQKALELYEEIISMRVKPVVSMMNALITALCDGDQLPKAVEILSEMKKLGLCPNSITYSILLVATEKKDDLEVGLMLLSQAKKDGIAPNLVMCRCLIALCHRRFEKACTVGEPILSFNSGRLLIDSKWTSLVLMIYRETINAGVVPTIEELSQVLACLRLPQDTSLKTRLIENLGVTADTPKGSNLSSLIDGFGEYDSRAFSLLEEAASRGIVPCISLKESPIVVDVTKFPSYTAEVYFLTVLKGLKHRLAAGVKLPNISILLPIAKTRIKAPTGEKTINVAGRTTQAISALLRRLMISYIGDESFGKIRINGVVVKKWLQPKLSSPYGGKPTDFTSLNSRLAKGISNQQRNIRSNNLSFD